MMIHNLCLNSRLFKVKQYLLSMWLASVPNRTNIIKINNEKCKEMKSYQNDKFCIVIEGSQFSSSKNVNSFRTATFENFLHKINGMNRIENGKPSVTVSFYCLHYQHFRNGTPSMCRTHIYVCSVKGVENWLYYRAQQISSACHTMVSISFHSVKLLTSSLFFLFSFSLQCKILLSQSQFHTYYMNFFGCIHKTDTSFSRYQKFKFIRNDKVLMCEKSIEYPRLQIVSVS